MSRPQTPTEEKVGLLSGTATSGTRAIGGARGRKLPGAWWIAFIALVVILTAFAPTFCLWYHPRHINVEQGARLTNGTHEYEKTVILVSIDGLR